MGLVWALKLDEKAVELCPVLCRLSKFAVLARCNVLHKSVCWINSTGMTLATHLIKVFELVTAVLAVTWLGLLLYGLGSLRCGCSGTRPMTIIIVLIHHAQSLLSFALGRTRWWILRLVDGTSHVVHV